MKTTFTAQGRIPKGKPQCEPSKLLLDGSHCGLPSVHAKARRGDPEHGCGYTRPRTRRNSVENVPRWICKATFIIGAESPAERAQ